jgi:hypothetical protein
MYFDRQPKPFGEELPPEVQATFAAYRASVPDFDASPEFMPKLWQRIESERKVRFSFSRLTRALVPVSACLCAMTFAVALLTPLTQNLSNQHSTWVEVVADDNSDDDTPAI